MQIRTRANLYLVLALLLGALFPVMIDLARDISTAQFLFYTYALSTLTSLSFVLLMKKKERLVSYIRNGRDFLTIAFIGLLNYALLEYGLSYTERFVDASLATAVYRAYPLLMLLFIPLVLRERVTRYQVIALFLGFAGLFVALTGGDLTAFSGPNLSVMPMLVAMALASALATLLVKRFVFDMESSMFIFNLANLLFFALLFAASGFPSAALSMKDAMAIAYVGTVYNVFVGFMYYDALRMLKTTFVTNIYFLSPFLTFVFAYLILGEQIQAYYLLIAGLVAVGIVIQKFDTRGGTFAQKAGKERRHAIIYDVTSAFVNSGEAAIHDVIKGGGKVLAVKVDKKHYDIVDRALKNTERKEVLLYTDLHDMVKNEEAEFIRDIIGAEPQELVFMGAGDTGKCETALTDFMDTIKE